MELLLGSHVREHGARVGRLAGFEIAPADRRIRRIIFSPDGNLGPDAHTRPLAAIAHVHDNGEIELRADIDVPPMDAVPEVILWSRVSRVRTANRTMARLVGLEINPGDRTLLSILVKTHWWSRAASIAAVDLDLSTPGEIHARARTSTHAA